MIRYSIPRRWIHYDSQTITNALATAKATILSLQTIPYQKQWVERLQQAELKREIAGTSRIEGAEFTERELEEALQATTDALVTRSQRQARAVKRAYDWIASIPDDRPTDAQLIREIHRRIVTGADDDHCPPGELRKQDQNVIFGMPEHRGAGGGQEVDAAFQGLADALRREFRDHDPIVRAMAAHYHLAAMHPFLDGNGRTARALEALLLKRAGLRDTAFVAMSNYYYEEKTGYLKALAETRARDFDLTPFLSFALKGVEVQGGRLLGEIRREMQKEMFRSLAQRLFTRLESKRKRVIGVRQLGILETLLETGSMTFGELRRATASYYHRLKNPGLAVGRDVMGLEELGAIAFRWEEPATLGAMKIHIRLEWPAEITESEFFERMRTLPKAKTHPFLR
jgi:cell filamentation protein, protein adenylyltransferase